MALRLPDDFPALTRAGIGQRIDELCAIGNRFVGTAGEERARTLLRHEFERLGLANVREEPVPTLAYEGIAAACKLTSGERSLSCVGMQFTASGSAAGAAVYLGKPSSLGDIEHINATGGELEGRVAVLHTPAPWMFADYLADAGVVALVAISEAPAGVISHLTAQMYPAPAAPEFENCPLAIPGVVIERDAGFALLAEMTSGPVQLSVEHEATYHRRTTANVVGDIRGDSDEIVLIAAHYDTQRDGVGAHDNATGVAALLEVAAQWATLRPARTVRIAGFCDEEHGLRGATGYCVAHGSELAATRALIYMDALAWKLPGTRQLIAEPAVAAYAAERASEIGWTPQVIAGAASPPSDLTPFVSEGVPAVRFVRLPAHAFYHSVGDTPELLDLQAVTDVANVSAYTAWSIAHAPLGARQDNGAIGVDATG